MKMTVSRRNVSCRWRLREKDWCKFHLLIRRNIFKEVVAAEIKLNGIRMAFIPPFQFSP
jgi:hypothetical protein